MRVTAVGDATSLADRKRRAGQRMLLGIAGLTAEGDARRLIAQVGPAGFVLGPANGEEPAQLFDLTRELAALVDPHDPALLAAAVHGGDAPLVAGATRFPSPRAMARAASGPADVGTAIARELRALGFDLNLAPWTEASDDPRAFSARPDGVAAAVRAFVTAHHAERVAAAVGPVPPGEGPMDALLDALTEADVGVITVDPELGEPGLDALSLADGLLTGGQRGAELSDQLLHATRAGVDLFLVPTSLDHQLEVYEALVRLQEHGADRAAAKSMRRLHAHRERFFLAAPPRPPMSTVGCPEHRALASMLAERYG